MKLFIRPIMVLVLLNALSISFLGAVMINSKGEWYLASPPLKEDVFLGKKNIPFNCIDTLREIGNNANELWRMSESNQEKTTSLEQLFHTVDRNFLIHLIDGIVTDKDALSQIAQASYRNVTGFWKIVLATGNKESSWKIRLHIWEKQEEKEFPHNHKWDFYSKIITGYLEQDLYTFSAASTCDMSIDYAIHQPKSLMPTQDDGTEPCPCRDHYVLDPVTGIMNDTVSLKKNEMCRIGAGESYYMPHHLIHSINPSRGAISLVFTSDRVAENSQVFVPSELADVNLSKYAPSISIEDLKTKLLAIKRQLQSLQLRTHYLPEMVHSLHQYYDVNNGDTILKVNNWRAALNTTKLSTQQVKQLTPSEMEHCKVCVGKDKNIMIDGQPIDTSKDYIFVLMKNTLYATPKDFHHENTDLICHTSFTDYGPVESVGVFSFHSDGKIKDIEAYSGHYMPSKEHMHIARNYLKSIGVNVSGAQCILYRDRKRK